MASRVELLESPDWFLQPGDRLAQVVAEELQAEPVFRRIFGEAIFSYKRMDIGIREMPALRVYNDTGRKEGETWYLSGDLKIDVIFPADIRRHNTQRFADLVASTLIAMFRAQPFFNRVRARVPGLNQLGWFLSYDKSLGFKPGEDVDPCPVTQITVNFRVLLEEWDRYMESDDRTSQQPFEKTLGDLERMYIEIFAQDDAGTEQAPVLTTIDT